MSTYSDVFTKNNYQLQAAAAKSKSWFQQQATLLAGQKIQPLQLINTNTDKNKNKITPGEMYLFMYDAKLQDTLPYWDMFPLVFPFRKLKDGFIGLNMHYLPYQMRVALLDRLLIFRTTRTLNEKTKLKFCWSTIISASKYSLAEPCVHRYLSNHIQTPLKKIDSTDWATALLLPVERFVGSSKQKVWAESMRRT